LVLSVEPVSQIRILSTISFMGFRIRGNTFSSFFTIIQRLREIMEDNLKHLLRKSGGAFAPPEV